MGNLCSFPDTNVFNIDQEVTCFVTNRSNDAIVHYNNILDAYKFASTVIDTHIGNRQYNNVKIISFNDLCDLFEKNPTECVIIDHDTSAKTYIYLGHHIHDQILIYNPRTYKEKYLIEHYNKVKVENYFR